MTQHGACLGLGLAGLGSNDEEALEEVKGILYTDSAVAGEAAGIALGLIAVGSASERAQELLTYAHDTQHEKVRWRHCAALIFPALRLNLPVIAWGMHAQTCWCCSSPMRAALAC